MDDLWSDTDNQANRHKPKKRRRRGLSRREREAIYLRHLVVYDAGHPGGTVEGLPEEDQPPRPFATFQCHTCKKTFLLDYLHVWQEVPSRYGYRRRGKLNLCGMCHYAAQQQQRLVPRWEPGGERA